MGDLVLLENEVNPVMSAALDNGLDVTALHNHFFWEQPRMFCLIFRRRAPQQWAQGVRARRAHRVNLGVREILHTPLLS